MAAPDFIEQVNCTNASDFIAELSPRSSKYRSVFPGGWVFRGHSCDESFQLIPTAFRRHGELLSAFSGITINNTEDLVHAEKEVLHKFLQIADSIGLSIPEDTQSTRLWFDDRSNNRKLWPPLEALSLMALAQHHGVPTRLLDWSRNPLKAAWFAAETDQASSSGHLSVWALSVEMLDMLNGYPRPFQLVTAPSATNVNLRAQEGVFTFSGQTSPDKSPVPCTPFDEMLRLSFEANAVTGPRPWFYRITLPKSEAVHLRFQLAFEGITKASLFPDFYGVAESIKDEASWYKEGGPGHKRMVETLSQMEFSYRTEVKIAQSFISTFNFTGEHWPLQYTPPLMF